MKLAQLFLAAALVTTLSACDNNTDESVRSGGGGSSTQSSDGGTNSAQYVGVYRGQLVTRYEGEGLSPKDDITPATLRVTNDGMVNLTVKDYSVGGTINGDQVEVDIILDRSESGYSCSAKAKIRGTVNNNVIEGPVSGNGTCKALAGIVKRKFKLSGLIKVRKAS